MAQVSAPAQPGSYVLVLRADCAASLQVGSLGLLTVTPGWYAYAGSAQGPGGLRGRLAHHLRPLVRPHWHIDYLRTVTEVVEVHWAVGERNLEHAWAAWLAGLPGAGMPLARFGASDCRCPAHLVRFDAQPALTLPGIALP